MSTNFYFKIKTDININIPIGGNIKQNILDKINTALEDATELYIGKRSVGWYPLFESTEYYSSVEEIKNFYQSNKTHLDIIDECGRKYTLEELEDELFNWNKDNLEARSHLDLSPNYYLDKDGYEFLRNSFS